MKNFNVCHVSTMTNLGGVEWILTDYLSNVSHSRFSHSLLTTSSSPNVIRPLLESNLNIFQPNRRYHYDPRAIFQMVEWLKSQNCYIVHGYNAKGVEWGGLSSFLAKTPIFIAGEHGSVWTIRPFDFILNYFAYHKANIVLANSEAAKILLCYRYQIRPENVKVLKNVVSDFSLNRRGLLRKEFKLGSKFIIGSVGRLVPQKGFEIFIQAAKEICHYRKDIVFVIIGGGKEYNFLQSKIIEYGLQNYFFLTGWRNNARDLIQDFDIYVNTSISESFGNSLIEAALAEIPVIAPKVDGIPEAVEDGVTGRLIQPTKRIDQKDVDNLPSKTVIDSKIVKPSKIDTKDFVNVILEFIENPDIRKKYGTNGRKRALKLFSLKRYTNDLENIYESSLGYFC